MIMEDGVWMQKASREPAPQGRLVRSMRLWLLCHLLESPLQQGGGTVPALPLALCPNLLSPIHLTLPLQAAAPLVPPPPQQWEGSRLQLAVFGRGRESSESSGGGLHRKDPNKLGNRLRAGSGRSSQSQVNCDHRSLASYPDLLCGLWMLLPPFHKDRVRSPEGRAQSDGPLGSNVQRRWVRLVLRRKGG